MRTHLSPAAIGNWSARHPWRAIALWLAFVIVAVAALALTGTKQLESGTTGESARAETMLRQHHARPAQHEYAYLHSNSLHTDDPTFRGAITKVKAEMEKGLDRKSVV